MSIFCLATSEVLDLFTEEIRARSGRVTDTFDDGRRLFTRSTLPQLKHVRPRDRLQGGVALKATSEEICVYPYVFREVCRNGAIMAHSLHAHRLVLADDVTQVEADFAIREAVGACCRDEVFANSMNEIRSTVGADVDLALTALPFLSQVSTKIAAHIFERFFGGRDSSRYGLMNAVTSVARDAKDPEERWRLEELGGGIAAEIMPKPSIDPNAVHFRRHDLVEIG